ncbi:glyoxalase/bleomycin resistance protein/dioxygenase superfamily protein 21 [Auricularia subglabra TFB-10046 SS5]|nr:glyoxalase/bleomycin resistance protein/dioxygenase superfamily protein 21 [Auricularia subglabra TFB-10046 SS5]
MAVESYYDTNATRLSFLGHLSIGVRDIRRSEIFYTAAFAPFGITLVFKSAKTLGYGWGEREPLNIFERADASPPAAGCHIAFNAPSRAAVDAFHAAALAHGGQDDGKPGMRPEYHDNYYACFVKDPDGYRLEAVYQQPVE